MGSFTDERITAPMTKKRKKPVGHTRISIGILAVMLLPLFVFALEPAARRSLRKRNPPGWASLPRVAVGLTGSAGLLAGEISDVEGSVEYLLIYGDGSFGVVRPVHFPYWWGGFFDLFLDRRVRLRLQYSYHSVDQSLPRVEWTARLMEYHLVSGGVVYTLPLRLPRFSVDLSGLLGAAHGGLLYPVALSQESTGYHWRAGFSGPAAVLGAGLNSHMGPFMLSASLQYRLTALMLPAKIYYELPRTSLLHEFSLAVAASFVLAEPVEKKNRETETGPAAHPADW